MPNNSVSLCEQIEILKMVSTVGFAYKQNGEFSTNLQHQLDHWARHVHCYWKTYREKNQPQVMDKKDKAVEVSVEGTDISLELQYISLSLK